MDVRIFPWSIVITVVTNLVIVAVAWGVITTKVNVLDEVIKTKISEKTAEVWFQQLDARLSRIQHLLEEHVVSDK